MDSQETKVIAQVFRTTARPYKEQKKAYLDKVMEFFISTADKFGWPHEKETWNVYLLTESLFGHYALMFEYDKTKATFFIDLWLDRENLEQELQVIMRFGIPSNKLLESKEIPLGPIEQSLDDIFDKAYDVLQDLGAYHATTNNCQNYAKDQAKALGAPKEVKTGYGTVTRTAFTLLAAVSIVVGFKPVAAAFLPAAGALMSKL